MPAIRAVLFFSVLSSAAALGQQIIPLSFQLVGDNQRLVIFAGINGSPPVPYLLDTGSPGFNAAYYQESDGPYTGSLPNPAAWTANSTLRTGAEVSYGSGLTYTLNAVTVRSIEIYASTNLAVPAAFLRAPHDSDGFIIGQITDADGAGADSFKSNLAAGLPPLPSGHYGTFGASLFTGFNSTGSPGPAALASTGYVNASVLGQSTTSGWAVVANGTSPYLIHGLNADIRSQFDSAVDWTGTADHTYPITGAPASTEWGGGAFSYRLTGEDKPTVEWTSDTLLDTGTPNMILLNAPAAEGSKIHEYETVAGFITQGHSMQIVGAAPGAEPFSYLTAATGSSPNVRVTRITADGTPHSTVGIEFFLHNSVAFDLENQKTLYTSALVVPEPSSIWLVLGAVAGWFLLGRRKAFCRGACFRL